MNKFFTIEKFERILPLIVLFVVGLMTLFQVIAIVKLPPLGDEPQDLAIIANDLNNLFFFSNIFSYDQARLPYIISMPLVAVFNEGAFIFLRLFFLVFHLLFIYFSYKIAKLFTDNKIASYLFALLLVTSCYLSSFSVLTLTSGDNLYLFLFAVCTFLFAKSFLNLKEKGVFTNYLLLSLFVGLCIASKLFGVLLLIAFFIFHFFYRKIKVFVRFADFKNLLITDFLFLFLLILINFSNFSNFIKFSSAMLFSLLFLLTIVFYIYRELKNQNRKMEVNFFTFWAAIIFTSFNLTVIFSPIYLNFNNILRIFGWVTKWGWSNEQLNFNSHYYDIFVIILVKFGFLSLVVLMIVLAILIKNYSEIRKYIKKDLLLLFSIIFLVNFIALSIPKHKVTWWPLSIFFFFYLPIICLFCYVHKINKKKFFLFYLSLVIVIIISNLYRYLYWFPYSHLDGAQYGKSFIGYNRSSFISFELGPQIVEYIEKFDGDEPISISIQFTDISRYNSWITAMLREKLKEDKDSRFVLLDKPIDESNISKFDYIFTNSAPSDEVRKNLKNYNFKELKKFKIKSLEAAIVWQK